jgi:PAS domain-containing protein
MGSTEADQELQRFRDMFARSQSFSALLQGPEHRFVLVNPAYLQLVGHRDLIGLTVREAIPEIEGQGLLEPLDDVFAGGKPFVGKDVKIVLRCKAEGNADTRYLDFVYHPIIEAHPAKFPRYSLKALTSRSATPWKKRSVSQRYASDS